MSVPIHCPVCICEHLHAYVLIDADQRGGRFEVLGEGAEPDTVEIRINPDGRLEDPAEVTLQCCSCDWTGERIIASTLRQ